MKVGSKGTIIIGIKTSGQFFYLSFQISVQAFYWGQGFPDFFFSDAQRKTCPISRLKDDYNFEDPDRMDVVV